jgi:hypothetical protein
MAPKGWLLETGLRMLLSDWQDAGKDVGNVSAVVAC